jgi:hypothetical protein
MRSIKQILQNKKDIIQLLALIIIYTVPLLLTITWGIPNPNHPFLYHMDEWHQFMSVRAVFKQLSNNVPGAAHGPMLQFILTGFYLIPFYLLHIINPFVLKSSLDALTIQEKIFILLRLNTVLFGIGSISGIYFISKKYLKINPLLASLLFLATPVWIMLSGYFKYDIALIFWIICSLGFLLNYRDHPTRKNFLISCAICALTLATKISALPVIPIYVVAFLLFTPKLRQNSSWAFLGTAVFIGVFCLVGIPDVLLHRGDYREFLYSNLISGPQTTQNIKLNANEFFYLFFRHYPVIFGHAFFFLILVSLVFFLLLLAKKTLSSRPKRRDLFKSVTTFKKIPRLTLFTRNDSRTNIFLISSFLFFLVSILPLKMTATGNRSLVLLPFFTLLCALAVQKLQRQLPTSKILINSILVAIICIQFFETYSWINIKLSPDPRQTSSVWIQTHIPQHSHIGLENIPIYQMIPDLILKDYYTGNFNPKAKTQYQYAIIDAKTKQLPPYIIISGADYETTYLKTSPKKDLINRLKKSGYKQIAEFTPNLKLYYLFNNELNYYLSAIIPSDPITIYQKK